MNLLDIGEVSARSGVPPSALRYYEEQGLIAPVSRRGLRRQYPPGVLLQLALIGLGKRAGFSLSEIGAIFRADGPPELPRDALHQRADQLERQIREMTLLVSAMRHVADCPAPSHLDCPSFQRLLRVGVRQQQRGAKKNGDRKAPV